MPFCSTPLLPGKKPWNFSNAPTCSSSPWTTSGVGTAITISLLTCCGSDCSRAASSSVEDEVGDVTEYHRRASAWYEENGLEIEAFHHAAAANDIERAARLIEGKGMPLHFRGAMAPVLNWLESLPTTVLDARPSLWVTYASALTMSGQPTSSVEEKLQAAEAALQDVEPDDKTQDLVGHIAAIRAMLAVPQNQVETIIAQSRRALEYLHPDNLPVRTTTTWTLGYAYQLQGDRAAASRAYSEAIVYQPGVWQYHGHLSGHNLSGPGTGSRKPALSGGRDLPARPATGR